MTYEKPEVIDFGSIGEHTYWGGWDGWFRDCFSGSSPHGDKTMTVSFWGSS